MDMLHIKLKRIRNTAEGCQQTVNSLPMTLAIGLLGKNSTSSKHGHVAYQIKEN